MDGGIRPFLHAFVAFRVAVFVLSVLEVDRRFSIAVFWLCWYQPLVRSVVFSLDVVHFLVQNIHSMWRVAVPLGKENQTKAQIPVAVNSFGMGRNCGFDVFLYHTFYNGCAARPGNSPTAPLPA